MLRMHLGTGLVLLIAGLATGGRASAVEPTAPDTLGGVTIGTVFDRRGFRCDHQTCRRDLPLAGIDGELAVGLCGPRVHELIWKIVYAESNKKDGIPIAASDRHFRVSVSVIDDASLAMSALEEGMQSLGWVAIGGSEHIVETGVSGLRKKFIHRTGNIRTLGAVATKDMLSDGVSMVVALTAQSPHACQVGL